MLGPSNLAAQRPASPAAGPSSEDPWFQGASQHCFQSCPRWGGPPWNCPRVVSGLIGWTLLHKYKQRCWNVSAKTGEPRPTLQAQSNLLESHPLQGKGRQKWRDYRYCFPPQCPWGNHNIRKALPSTSLPIRWLAPLSIFWSGGRRL